MSAFPDPVNLKTRRTVDMFLGAPAANVAAATAVATTVATANKPVTGAGQIVVDLKDAGIDNHLLVWLFSSLASTAVDVLCVGWKRCKDTGVYEPMPLAQVQGTADSTNSQAILGTALYPMVGLVKNLGDCKLYPGSGTYKVNGCFALDTWSLDLVSLQATRTGGSTPNWNAKLCGS